MTEHMDTPRVSEGIFGLGGKFLTFRLMGEEFGLEIIKVQEIIGLIPITKIPMSPTYINGVVNLRGQIVPVLDLRTRFGIHGEDYTEKTCIIVLETVFNDRYLKAGIIVDEVAEVLDIPNPSIQESPNFGASLNEEFVIGMGVIGEKVIQLLDVDRMISPRTISQLTTSAGDGDDTELLHA